MFSRISFYYSNIIYSVFYISISSPGVKSQFFIIFLFYNTSTTFVPYSKKFCYRYSIFYLFFPCFTFILHYYVGFLFYSTLHLPNFPYIRFNLPCFQNAWPFFTHCLQLIFCVRLGSFFFIIESLCHALPLSIFSFLS